jgi:type 1 glutamine amidotransferase
LTERPDGAARRNALVVRGGWEGHSPREATDSFLPFLNEEGYDVHTSGTLDAYADPDLMAGTDLIVQCWTQGTISREQLAGLSEAITAGTGFAGWHGGIADSFRNSSDYLHLVGGQFACHPGGFVDYAIEVSAEGRGHPIVEGFTKVEVHTEQYWVLADAYSQVLATTTLPSRPGDPWRDAVVSPAVWARRWGAGRIVVCTVGHRLEDLDVPEIRAIVERGMTWASR